MKIEESFVLDAHPERAFAFLADVERVARCVPGVTDLERQGDGSYGARLRTEVGPIKAVFAGQLELTPRPPDQLTAHGKGRDRTSGSRAEVTFDARLSPVDQESRTRVDSVADVTIRGRLGQFGTGVIRATATEVIREFVDCANQQLAGVEPRAEPAAVPPASGRLLWRALVALARGWWRRLLGRGSPSDTRAGR